MQRICPVSFDRFAESTNSADDETECQTVCDGLRDRGEYDATLTGEDTGDELGDATVQCRLWHLGAAAIDKENGVNPELVHCKHAVGGEPCRQPSVP
jgi:hypothetical protein